MSFDPCAKPYADEIATGEPVSLSAAIARLAARLGGVDYKEEVERAAGEIYEKYRDQFNVACAKGLECCESPIEKMLLPWLIAQRYQFFEYNPAVLLAGETSLYVPRTIAVVPQLPIGRYRVDFALAGSLGGIVRFVVVECDGKQFHDGFENVTRDLDRDMAILANKRVLGVFRADGKDIRKDARGVAQRAAKAVLEAWSKKNKDNDEKFRIGGISKP